MDWTETIYRACEHFVSLFPLFLIYYVPFRDSYTCSVKRIVYELLIVSIVFSAAYGLLFVAIGFDEFGTLNSITCAALVFIRSFWLFKTGMSKRLFIEGVMIHTYAIGSTLAPCLLHIEVYARLSEDIWFMPFMPARVVVYALAAWVIYRWFTPRIKKINPDDMKGMWLFPLFFNLIFAYFMVTDYQAATLANNSDASSTMYVIMFLVLAPLSFALYVFLFNALENFARKAQAEAEALRFANEKDALERLDRMKSEMIAAISHETRTPLAVLSVYADIISMELHEQGVSEQIARNLDIISNETQRIANMMEQMQHLSQKKNSEIKRMPLDMGDIVQQVGRLYQPILERRNVLLEIETGDKPHNVFGSPDELTQVLFNLLQNAKNHTENGVVRVELKVENDEVLVVITDTGNGIAPELMPQLFQRGVSDSGSGLGLAISKEIIESHGGYIGIESEPGKGTTVTFALPAFSKEDDDEQ